MEPDPGSAELPEQEEGAAGLPFSDPHRCTRVSALTLLRLKAPCCRLSTATQVRCARQEGTSCIALMKASGSLKHHHVSEETGRNAVHW